MGGGEVDISLLTLREEKRRRRKVFAVAWRRGSSSEESFFSAFDSQRPRRGGEEVFRDRTEEEGESVMSDGQNTRLEKNEWRKKSSHQRRLHKQRQAIRRKK